jgi:hypothetical protein
MPNLNRFALLLSAMLAAAAAQAQSLAPTPPMGWNSWDGFGLTIDEADFKANTTVLAGLKPFGWNYAVIDEGWYMANPLGDKLETRQYLLDGNGMLLPVDNRFPSAANGAGFKPLADWVHAQGLKFGIHILRGIPKQAVRDNLPIAGSSFHAADAADTADTCPWDDGNFGISDTPAGQAYYDSEMKYFADWGVDFIKVDCIADHPYKGSEIRQIAQAIAKTGRPMVLSLSPGPTQLSHAAEVGAYSQMWRIADDIWDGWDFKPAPWPNGVVTAFDNLAKWNAYAKPGNWPDADMLPFGSLTPHPGWGEARQSRLTPDEERTQFTLWAIARSPLILGGNLTKLDDFTKSLITNKDVVTVNQTSWDSHPVAKLPAGFEQARVWIASAGQRNKPSLFVAFFNLDNKPVVLHTTWKQLGLNRAKHSARDLWAGKTARAAKAIDVALPAHGSTIYRVK